MHPPPKITEKSLDSLSRFLLNDLLVLSKDKVNPWGFNPPTYKDIFLSQLYSYTEFLII